MTAALPPNSTIGILGDGQLGRMMALAAAPLGYKVHVFGPTPDSPAGQVCDRVTVADYTDTAALKAFGEQIDVVTLEFENLPVSALEILAPFAPVRPNQKALATAQDRLLEKNFMKKLGLTVPPFSAVHSLEDLKKARITVGENGVLKTTRLGYDGKGQIRLEPGANLVTAWEAMKGAPAIYEGFINFEREISVVLARGINGDSAVFDPSHNIHRNHILHTSSVPAGIPQNISEQAKKIAIRIAEGLDYIGVMAVELFITPEHDILVNEMAPRPHNSGHWTIDACLHSQFSQAIRAVAGLPLGKSDRWADVVMTNLIGDEINQIQHSLDDPECTVHLYGKTEIRSGRKMGHINTIKRPISQT